jgi:hypothetical protein
MVSILEEDLILALVLIHYKVNNIVAFSFIGGGNRRIPPTYHKPLTNFIT